jgi:uncharacterized protein (TIGR02594 family)
MQQALDIAARAIGLNETDKKVALQDFMATGGMNLDPATRAWCADFVNATLSQAGMKGTGSGMARTFLEWGEGVDQPQRGDVAVFSRGDPNGPFGHVGFFEGYNPDGSIRVLGGNQGDAVSIANYGADQLLGFRRAPGQPQGNALAQGPAAPASAPQNALAPTLADYGFQMQQQDVSPFLRAPNALALRPIV